MKAIAPEVLDTMGYRELHDFAAVFITLSNFIVGMSQEVESLPALAVLVDLNEEIVFNAHKILTEMNNRRDKASFMVDGSEETA